MAKVLIIAGYASSLYNFRGPLIKALLRHHDVITTAPFDTEEVSKKIEQLGVTYFPNKFQRAGMNPFADQLASKELQRYIEREAPDVVLAYTIKPVVFGLRSAQKAGVKKTFALITGLGSGFDDTSLKQKVISKVVKQLYKRVLYKTTGVIFQNPDDKKYFVDNDIIESKNNWHIVNGSGVDLSHYKSDIPNTSPLSFLLVARMVREKGVEIFVNVARRVKMKYPEAIFRLLGWVDENPNSLSLKQIEAWQKEGFVIYHGSATDVRSYYKKSSVFVLPTYYREGTPRTILEAMSMKRPIITTDTPGCRETVVQGKNGFLIPPRDEDALYEKVVYFLENPDEVVRMGMESFKVAQEKYDVNKVNHDIMKFMELK